MRLFEFASVDDLSFYNGTTDSYQGQINGVLWAYDKSKYPSGFDLKQVEGPGIFGYIEWSMYKDEIQIDMIEVLDSYRRMGIAKRMVQELQQTTDKPLVWSTTTDSGEKLRTSMQNEAVRQDVHGKNIVWEDDEYFVAIDSIKNLTYITAWQKRDDRDKRIGEMSLSKGRYHETKDYMIIRNVELDKRHRGNRLGLRMYQAAFEYLPDDAKGLASEGPDRSNKTQVPAIFKRLGGRMDDGGNIFVDK